MNQERVAGKPRLKDYEWIKRPVVTEKSTMNGGLFFEVCPRADKLQLKGALERIFDVEVDSVRTLMRKGKPSRGGVRRNKKLAYVTLKPGYKIELIEGI